MTPCGPFVLDRLPLRRFEFLIDFRYAGLGTDIVHM